MSWAERDRTASCVELTFSVRCLSSQSSLRNCDFPTGRGLIEKPQRQAKTRKCLSLGVGLPDPQDTHPRVEPGEVTLPPGQVVAGLAQGLSSYLQAFRKLPSFLS